MVNTTQVPDGPDAHDTPDSETLYLPELIYPSHSLTSSPDTLPATTMSFQYGPVQPEQIRVFPSRSTDNSARPSPITTRSSQSSYHSTASHFGPPSQPINGDTLPPFPQHIAVFPSSRNGAPPMAHSHSQPTYPRHGAVPPPMVHSHSQPGNPTSHPAHVEYRTSYHRDGRSRTSSVAYHAEHYDSTREHERAYREERYREEREHRRPRTRSLTTAEHREVSSRRQATLIPSDLAEVGHAPTERLARSHVYSESERGHSRSQSVRRHSSKHATTDGTQRVQVIVMDASHRKSMSARSPASAVSHSPTAHFPLPPPTGGKSSFLAKLLGKRSGGEVKPRW